MSSAVSIKPRQALHAIQGHCAQLSVTLEDGAWDKFLEQERCGHMQQSSLWAKSKEIEHWRPIRVLLKNAGVICGGFQILARPSRFGRIGYISKGPVLASNEPELVRGCFRAILSTAKSENIRALIIQPPDESHLEPEIFLQHAFLPNRLLNLISATFLVDISCSKEAMLARMRKTTSWSIRSAARRGVKMREGTTKDVGMFFKLMTETCKRQHTLPSPASETALRAVWDVFSQRNLVRMGLAEYESQTIAGILCLCFGERVTLWKKGWSGAHPDKHPNELATFEGMEWAHNCGYKIFDWCGMDRSNAESLLGSKKLSEEQTRSRDFFLLGFGGRPVLLPESWIYIPNQLARFAYKTLFTSPCFRPFTKRLIRSMS